MQLHDPDLFRQAAFIGGAWLQSDTGAVFQVLDPASGAVLGEAPDMGGAETDRAIAAAAAALVAWRARPAKNRSRILRRWFELMMEARDDLAALITAEQGKPLAEAKGEVVYGASFVEWFAEEAKRVYGDIIPAPAADRRILATREPIGVCAAITPWNFPMAMITRKAAAALAAGCTMVIKPSELTPYSALALAVLAERAGVPAGVLNIVTGLDAAAIGGALCRDPMVRKISFTGSTEVGRILLRQSAETIKKCTLELGGNAPVIVFDDADLDLAVKGALAVKFGNAGQACIAANRIFVQAAIHDRFAEAFTQAAAALGVGPGDQAGVAVGPLIDARALAKVERHVADATRRGGQVALGGARHALGGSFYAPTVITGATPAMDIFREETFGPVAALFRFDDEAQVLAMANDSESGLAAYLFTRDLGRAIRVADGLQYGMVGVNETLISTESAPFGGMKQSGLGREGSRYGIEEYLEIKYICLGGLG
jgi:succinate-semialdehyde dehydrogenase/glutarate-semialdehyde dehydrogenase